MIARRCASDQRSILRYISSTECSTPPECAFFSPPPNFKKRELIIGVSVKATSSETRIAIAMVHPKEFTYFLA